MSSVPPGFLRMAAHLFPSHSIQETTTDILGTCRLPYAGQKAWIDGLALSYKLFNFTNAQALLSNQ